MSVTVADTGMRFSIRPRTLVFALVVALVVGSCRPSEGGGEEPPPGRGGETATETVELLIEALNAGDFSAAAPLAMPKHAALASLAEGATFGQVADALRSGDMSVAANFWGGFAQGAGSYLTGAVTVSGGETVERDEIVYHVVTVRPESGGDRLMLARQDDGYRIDLFASFAPGLAERMLSPVERLLTAQTEDSRLVMSELRDIVPSLLVAAETPGQPPEVIQSVVRLVELITRVG